MARNSYAFESRIKTWSAIIVALIAAISSITVALINSSPSTRSSADARITVVGQGRVSPTAEYPGATGYPDSAAPSGSAGSGSVSLPLTQSPAQPASSSSSAHWIAQLASIPYSDGSAERDRQLEQIQATIPQAQWLSSDQYGSLTPGFWVVYVDGPFTDGAAAFDFCRAHGISKETDCLGRYLSAAPADHGLQCAWTGAESPPAVCYAEPGS